MAASAKVLLFSAVSGSLALVFTGLPLAPGPVLLPSLYVLWLAGAYVGAVVGLLFTTLHRFSRTVQGAVWFGLGCAAGAAVAWKLGAFQKIDGPYRLLALATIVASTIGGTFLAALGFFVQPHAVDASSIERKRPWVRWSFFAGSLVIAMVALIVETTESVLAAYPVAQFSLAGFAWTISVLGTFAALDWSKWARRAALACGAGWCLLLAVFAQCLSTVGEWEYSVIVSTCPTKHPFALLRDGTDWDGDGASSFFGGGDCAPWDASRHPRARESPGNGVDDDCRYGDAKFRPPPRYDTPERPPAHPSPVNVLLITIDSLRPDHTTPYGYEHDTTPNLERLAKTGVRFDRAYTSGGWTCLALPTMLTGVNARRLQWTLVAITRDQKGVPFGEGRPRSLPENFDVMMSMPVKLPWSIQGALRARGLYTIAILHHYLTPFSPYLASGWDIMTPTSKDDDGLVTELAEKHLQSSGGRPFFLWVHYFNAHARHHDRVTTRDKLVARYDQRIRETDAAIGRLIQTVDAMTERPTVIVVTADHGELLHQSQVHGTDLSEESIRIPLLLRGPGIPPGTVQTPVSLLDVAPTLLALTETPVPSGLDGSDLRKVANNRALITDVWRNAANGPSYLDEIAITDADYRLTHDLMRNTTRLSRSGTATQPARLNVRDAPPALLATLGNYLDHQVGGPPYVAR